MNIEEILRIFFCFFILVDDYILENNKNMISVKFFNILYM